MIGWLKLAGIWVSSPLDEVPVSPFLQPVQVPLDSTTAVWCILLAVQCHQQICWGCRCPIIQSINENMKEVQTLYWPLVTLLQPDFVPLTTTSITIGSSSWYINNFFMRILWEILQLLLFCRSLLRFFFFSHFSNDTIYVLSRKQNTSIQVCNWDLSRMVESWTERKTCPGKPQSWNVLERAFCQWHRRTDI